MENIEILGFIAAVLTTGAYVPQVYKTWKLKSTKDISLSMYAAMFTGVLLWLIYGIHYKSIPIILANGITAILIMFVLVLKYKFK
ncbi:SemiSWEET transporter [Cellulophaga sp. F20128]|uniref:SemiSWEET family sugar transporter n=1 Tax=Cellulophaga sp. F20128 TaxID=2926413 RepID=UPI001FF6C1B8|nr:SemiSWEET transporter [Cellulophaga sp. F20128]MCK0158618.1 SemiSWEET transporter [Cellulophaga sp. F20128]